MGLFKIVKSLCGFKEIELPIRKDSKYCGVIFDGALVFVFATHYDTVGRAPYGEPMAALDYATSSANIGEAIIQSIRGSRIDLSPEDSETQSRRALSITPWRSWDVAERKYNVISICHDSSTNVAEVRLMHRYETGGHILADDDPLHSAFLDPKEIGELVYNLIHGPQPPIIKATPSHT